MTKQLFLGVAGGAVMVAMGGQGHVHEGPTPEPPLVVARPGQPAATLRPDDLDRAHPTAVREAVRAAELAAGGHAMSHGTYRQVDAGRDEVVADSPIVEKRGHSTAPAPPGAPPAGHPASHAGHGAAPPPSPAPDPHHLGHAPPSPRPSPGTKEQR